MELSTNVTRAESVLSVDEKTVSIALEPIKGKGTTAVSRARHVVNMGASFAIVAAHGVSKVQREYVQAAAAADFPRLAQMVANGRFADAIVTVFALSGMTLSVEGATLQAWKDVGVLVRNAAKATREDRHGVTVPTAAARKAVQAHAAWMAVNSAADELRAVREAQRAAKLLEADPTVSVE